ncbi:MAG: GNAT family N-acetyltransferase [Ginsengibacter sp.]
MAGTIPEAEIVIKTASTKRDFDNGRALFMQYADSLEFDLGFQNFSEELKTIDQQYNNPKGALLLAYRKEMAVGCVGIREYDDDTAELKRLYVSPEYRNYKIGRKLLEMAIGIAKNLHYHHIRLDTAPGQEQAQNLYRVFGFYEIPSYRFNPVMGTVYMEKKLI